MENKKMKNKVYSTRAVDIKVIENTFVRKICKPVTDKILELYGDGVYTLDHIKNAWKIVFGNSKDHWCHYLSYQKEYFSTENTARRNIAPL
jgi:hypothetical protein|tara:strand:+ start:1018 stop:1290 length:273 start_codon:yes stop_codon:yes gene_type:complete